MATELSATELLDRAGYVQKRFVEMLGISGLLEFWGVELSWKTKVDNPGEMREVESVLQIGEIFTIYTLGLRDEGGIREELKVIRKGKDADEHLSGFGKSSPDCEFIDDLAIRQAAECVLSQCVVRYLVLLKNAC